MLAVFVIGFAAGALSMNLYHQRGAAGPDRGGERGRPEEHIVNKMTQNLKLTGEQQQRIRSILDETFDQYRDIRKEMEPRIKDFDQRFNTVRQQSRDRIRRELTQEQLPLYEEMIMQKDREREEMKDRRK